ncbi:tryptophan halogenase family protein [Flocculibacter collagenilyticus]|uniref:tryptophan halogenase family protein n=1 Tax=Flocculibacter collagenilyticus TaxID=2744479 RepID=UPI0018F6A138|nr:tryptophan halogenase family protein [Flocculibacter collagenilyticus]
MIRTTIPKHIVIVGGGTAGWMSANLMAHKWRELGVKITLIESKKMGTLGVGEGSTPFLKDFFQTLNIPEHVWMPACNATYKCGIRFPDWSTVANNTSYFHPFYSDIDGELAQRFFYNANTKRNGENAPTNPDSFFVTSALANAKKAPKALNHDTEHSLSYGYHFDAELLGQFLSKHAISLGVKHIDDTITQVIANKVGDIALLNTEKHGPIRAGFFVDCSGFKGLLIQDALGEKLTSYKDYLFNDSAVAIPTLHDGLSGMACETVSKALKHGWVWHIPLINRMGNGYVYSSAHSSKEAAELELRELLGDKAIGQKALHLHWQPGRIENHWKKNCVAIGLSQGFLEPLEAPMLYLVQRSIESFIEKFTQGSFTDEYQQAFNNEINNIIDGTRDYLQAHYKINSRNDTQYWKDCRENTMLSPVLVDLLDSWKAAGNFDMALERNMAKLAYLKTSWYCLLAGKSFFNESNQLSPSAEALKHQDIAAEKSHSSAMKFYDHLEYLQRFHNKESVEGVN